MESRPVVRAKESVQRHLDAKSYYEALQLCRTICNRLSAQKKFSELLNFAHDSILKFADAKQLSSAEDMAKVYASALLCAEVPVESGTLSQVKQIFIALKPDGSYTPDRQLFLKRLVTWSRHVSPEHTRGHPLLHQCIGEAYYQEDDYSGSSQHFQLCQNGIVYGRFLATYQMKHGIPSEVDLTVAQAVLVRMCYGENAVAFELFNCYCRHHSALLSDAKPPLSTPLLNFIYFVMLAIAKKSIGMFTVLVEKYGPSIERDPSFKDYLLEIAQKNFGASTARQTSANLRCANVSNGAEEDGDEPDRAAAVRPSTSTGGGPRRPVKTAIQADEDLD